MSSRRIRSIPQRAHVIRDTGPVLVTRGRNAGRTLQLQVFAADQSHGYQTDYRAVPVRWFVARLSGERPLIWRYSGQRIAEADRDYAANLRDLRKYSEAAPMTE